jgi:hypothetical protein
MKIEEKWPAKALELPIPKPQEPFPVEFVTWIESKLTTKRHLKRPPATNRPRPSDRN